MLARRQFLNACAGALGAVALAPLSSRALAPVDAEALPFEAETLLPQGYVHRLWSDMGDRWSLVGWQQADVCAQIDAQCLRVELQGLPLELRIGDFRDGYAQETLSRYFPPDLCEEILQHWLELAAWR